MNQIIYEETKYGTIYINRTEKHNAISVEMAQELSVKLEQIKDRPINFLIIKSAGDTFCAGGDLNDFNGNLSEDEAYDRLHIMKQVLFQIVTFPVPTICLLQGNAYGGGCELATACDIRIAKETTSFGFIQSKLGILPSWGGGALLYEKIHPSFAFHWLTVGKMYSANFLHDKGWIHEVISEDNWEDEQMILKNFTQKTLEQMRYLKNQHIEALSIPILLEKMEKESARCSALWGSQVHKQAIKSFLHK